MELELLEPPALNHPVFFDPLGTLDEVQQERWRVASERKKIIDAALDAAAVKPVPRQSRELIS